MTAVSPRGATTTCFGRGGAGLFVLVLGVVVVLVVVPGPVVFVLDVNCGDDGP